MGLRKSVLLLFFSEMENWKKKKSRNIRGHIQVIKYSKNISKKREFEREKNYQRRNY